MRKIDQLTFTRFTAALTVVIFHYGKNVFPFAIYPISELIPTGNIFVGYFYVLSGFIMAAVYFRPNEKFKTARYWFYRFARIYPVYLLGLILTILLNLKLLRDGRAVLFNVTLLQAWLPPYPNTLNYPGWSLSVETFFYILFPLLIYLAYRLSFKVNALLVGGFWLCSLVAHTYLLNTHYSGFPSFSHDVLFYNPLFHLNAFLLGCLGGRWFVEYSPKIKWRLIPNLVTLLGSYLLICLALLYFKDIPKLLGLNFRVALTNGSIAPLFLLLIVTLALDESILSRVFSHPTLVLLGDASYAVYILQYPVHTFYKMFIEVHFTNLSNEIHFYVYLLLLIIISILVFKFIESPARSTAKRLFTRKAVAVETQLGTN
jgi:peptidoglycan/LPS O-acetylase OafA/YrhL